MAKVQETITKQQNSYIRHSFGAVDLDNQLRKLSNKSNVTQQLLLGDIKIEMLNEKNLKSRNINWCLNG
jgi:hypothetical protein